MHGSFSRQVGEKTGFIKKFGKSWHSSRGIMPDETITEGMLCLLGPAEGFLPNDLYLITGNKAREYIPAQTAITPDLIYRREDNAIPGESPS